MKAILFDFDFTLADSGRPILECFRYAYQKLNLPVPDDRLLATTFGMTLSEAFNRLTPDVSPQLLQEQYKKRADEIMVDWTDLYPQVPELAKLLRQRDYKTGIISSKYRFRIEAILKKTGVINDFDIIIGYEDVITPKPDPEGLLQAIHQLGSKVSSVIYVGDSIIDAQTAQAAGVKFIGVTTGPASEEELYNEGTLMVVPDLGKLTVALDKVSRNFSNSCFERRAVPFKRE